MFVYASVCVCMRPICFCVCVWLHPVWMDDPVRCFVDDRRGAAADVKTSTGNDDYGTMSAWFAFTALGFYPVTGQDWFFVGSPLVSQVRGPPRPPQPRPLVVTMAVSVFVCMFAPWCVRWGAAGDVAGGCRHDAECDGGEPEPRERVCGAY
jgi:hypothetical protein